MSSITILQDTDTGAASKTAINANFAALNADKKEAADIAAKADKVSSATNGDFAGLDSNGNLTDSTSKAADFAVAAKGVTNGDSHDHNGGDGAAITEAAITLAANTTNDVSTTKHGFAPTLPNDASKFLNGVGTYSVPAGLSVDQAPNVSPSFSNYFTTVIRPASALSWSKTGTETQVTPGVIMNTSQTPRIYSSSYGFSTAYDAVLQWNSGIDLKMAYFFTPSVISAGITPMGSGKVWYFHGFSDGNLPNPADITEATHYTAGFVHYNGKIYTKTANGSAVTTNLIGNDPGQVKQHYIVDFTPSSVKFYINGTLVATHTTNIPSAAANIMLDFWGQNGTASNIGLFLSNITFAQTLN